MSFDEIDPTKINTNWLKLKLQREIKIKIEYGTILSFFPRWHKQKKNPM